MVVNLSCRHAGFSGNTAHRHSRQSFGEGHAHGGLQDGFTPLVLAQITHVFHSQWGRNECNKKLDMRSTLRRIASWTCVHVLKEKEIYVSSVVSVSDYRAGVYPGGDRRDGAARGGADIEHDAGASGNELLWIIDIYSLVMAGMVLPMGALGDRIGFKRLLMIGSTLFGLSSLAAAFAPSAGWLIAARASLAIGAAMIIPATLAGIRTLFVDAKDRNIALGVWAAVGSGGAAFGPLIGGMLLEHFYWGSVFLINVPIVLIVVTLAARFVPRQQGRPEQPLNISHAIMLIVAILLLVYSAKTALKGVLSPWLVACTLLTGAVMLFIFVRIQLRARVPMIDMRLFCHRIILSGVVMAMTAMIALVGFELLMAQELQFVHGFTPFEAGMFMLPLMVASGFSGPIAGVLVGRLGLRLVAAGDGAKRGQFYRPVDAGFQHSAVAGVCPDGSARL